MSPGTKAIPYGYFVPHYLLCYTQVTKVETSLSERGQARLMVVVTKGPKFDELDVDPANKEGKEDEEVLPHHPLQLCCCFSNHPAAKHFLLYDK